MENNIMNAGTFSVIYENSIHELHLYKLGQCIFIERR